MDSQQSSHIALNLSYVLHERSDSDTVRRYVRAREAEQRRCAKAIRQLAGLTDAELRRRLVVADQVASPGSPMLATAQIISANIGAVELLPRLLDVAGLRPPNAEATAGLLDAGHLHDERTLSLFGAPAALNTPAAQAGPLASRLFATAVLRPGYSSILLRVTAFDAGDGASNWQRAAHLAEAVIREFPLQWWCTRPLWSQPVEEALPEFRAIGNGTTACGH